MGTTRAQYQIARNHPASARRLAVVALCVFAVTTPSTLVFAQVDPLSELTESEIEQLVQLLEAARAFEDERNFEDALDRYEMAEVIVELDEYRYRQAYCLEQLERFADAAVIYRSLLDSENGTVARNSEGRLNTAERVLQTEPVELQIRTVPPGGSVFVDSDFVGTAGRAALADSRLPGEYTIRVELSGYEIWEEDVTLEPGSPPREVIAELTLASSRSIHPVSWVLGGLTLAAVGLGTVAGIVADDKAEQERNYDHRAPGATRDASLQLADEANQYSTIANVSFIAAGALAVGTLVTFFVLDGGGASDSDGVSLVPIVGPDLLGTSFGFSF